jgi:CheY-like chemotaxis protein
MRNAATLGTPYRLVLLDSHMPGMDGFEVAAEIKRSPQLAGSMVMMLTSRDQFGDVERCRQLGVLSYLVKPVRRSELLTTILRLLGESERHAAKSPSSIQKLDQPKLRILVAEDNPVNQHLAARLLQSEGQIVQLANNGREALRLYTEGKFDLILMDIQMPELDGFDTTREIRTVEAETGEHVPIIAMTAYAMKSDQQRCLAAGMDSYISKPVRKAELMASIFDCVSTTTKNSQSKAAAACAG